MNVQPDPETRMRVHRAAGTPAPRRRGRGSRVNGPVDVARVNDDVFALALILADLDRLRLRVVGPCEVVVLNQRRKPVP